MEGLPPLSSGPSLELAQEGALANASRAVHEHHAGRGVACQASVKVGQLGLAPEEAFFIALGQAAGQRRGGRTHAVSQPTGPLVHDTCSLAARLPRDQVSNCSLAPGYQVEMSAAVGSSGSYLTPIVLPGER